MDSMETTQEDKQRRRPGPTPGTQKMRTTVYLEPDLVDWGKQQPGGLSELMRRLLQDARAAASEAGKL